MATKPNADLHQCAVCRRGILLSEGYFNHPLGVLCQSCGTEAAKTRPTPTAYWRRVGRAALVALLLFAVPAVAQTPHHDEPPGFSGPGDRKVWVNTRSGVYHLEGERYYGSTKQGKYVCEKNAQAEGDRETKNGQ